MKRDSPLNHRATLVQKQTSYASLAVRILASAKVFRHTMATRRKLLGETLVQKQTSYAGLAVRILASAKVFRHKMATRQKLLGETLGTPIANRQRSGRIGSQHLEKRGLLQDTHECILDGGIIFMAFEVDVEEIVPGSIAAGTGLNLGQVETALGQLSQDSV